MILNFHIEMQDAAPAARQEQGVRPAVSLFRMGEATSGGERERWGWALLIATLVHAGLRDHRIGFMVMTLTGLTIVGGRVFATLRRQELDRWLRGVRVALRGWD